MSKNWFAEGDLDATLRDHGAKIVERVETLDPQLVRFSSESVVDELLREAMIVPLSFRWDEISRTAPTETTLDSTQFGQRNSVRGKSITLVIPFSGDPKLFECRANSFTYSGFPFGLVLRQNTMRVEIKGRELTAELINNELQKFRQMVEQQAAWSRADVENWTNQFRADLQSRVAQRKQQLDELAELDAALNIPLTPSVTNRVDVPLEPRRLRLAPVIAAPLKSDPRIADANYKEILAIISNLGRAQERLPRTASKFNEEELRDLILFTLNANFAGAARGEAFSGNGKTDIFLEWDGNNAFIAECKVWRGQKQFSEAIDQLLSYTVWRDSKAALILFIRSHGATDVIEKAKAALADHPRRSLVRVSDETGLTHYMLRSSTDEAKLVDVAFIPFVIVTPDKSMVQKTQLEN